jgi:hypothetical protein
MGRFSRDGGGVVILQKILVFTHRYDYGDFFTLLIGYKFRFHGINYLRSPHRATSQSAPLVAILL